MCDEGNLWPQKAYQKLQGQGIPICFSWQEMPLTLNITVKKQGFWWDCTVYLKNVQAKKGWKLFALLM